MSKDNGKEKETLKQAEFPIDVHISLRLKLVPSFPSLNLVELFVRALGSYLQGCGLGESFFITDFKAVNNLKENKIVVPKVAIQPNKTRRE